MKTLFLIRHAKAAGQEPEVGDVDRPLTKTGKKDARKMAKKVRKNVAVPQLIITSPAKRAVKSARLFAERFGYAPDMIVLNDLLYEPPKDAAEMKLLELVQNIDNQYQTVMIIGHDPLLSNFANFLQKSFTEKLPAGAVLELEFSKESWKDIMKNSAVVKFFDYPGKKKEERDKMEKDIRGKLEAAINRTLARVDKEITESMGDTIRKTVDKFAVTFMKELRGKEKNSKEKETAAVEAPPAKKEKKESNEKKSKQKAAEKKVKSVSKKEAASKKASDKKKSSRKQK